MQFCKNWPTTKDLQCNDPQRHFASCPEKQLTTKLSKTKICKIVITMAISKHRKNCESCVTQAAWKIELKSQSCCSCFLPFCLVCLCCLVLTISFISFFFLFIKSKSWMVIMWNWFVYKYKGFLHFTSSDGWLTCELYRFFQWFYWLKDLVEGRALWASLSRGDGFVLSSVTKNHSSVGKSFSM